MRTHPHANNLSSSDRVLSAVKNNPEGLLLLAAGCALLLRRKSEPFRRSASFSQGSQSQENGRAPMARAVETASQYAADLKNKVADTASSYTKAAGDYASETQRTVIDGSERLAKQAQLTAQSTIENVVNSQPLAIAFVGLAAGAAAAAVFSSTQIERRTLRPAADRLSDAAAAAGKQIQKTASAVGDQLKDAAAERGLNTEGLKEVVSQVADTVEGSFAGSRSQPSYSGNSTSSGANNSNENPKSSSTLARSAQPQSEKSSR